MERAPIRVINPNSSETVTTAMDAALAPLKFPSGPAIVCETLAEGPPGVETEAHIAQIMGPLLGLAQSRPASALVVACFSDPGVPLLREAMVCPVFGIAESAYLAALNLGQRFGVISILAVSVKRHLRHIRALGLEQRLAGDLPLGLGVTELAGDEAAVLERLTAVGETLRDQRGADVVILGCAGMARYRAALETRLGLSVVDPTQAATASAIAAVQLAWTTS